MMYKSPFIDDLKPLHNKMQAVIKLRGQVCDDPICFREYKGMYFKVQMYNQDIFECLADSKMVAMILSCNDFRMGIEVELAGFFASSLNKDNQLEWHVHVRTLAIIREGNDEKDTCNL